MKKSEKTTKILRGMVLVFPAVLYFSYYPVIALGFSESMNFELSLPLIYLVFFDVILLVALVREKMFVRMFDKWQFLVLPIFVTASVFWSSNLVRGMLTAATMWAVYFAIMGMVVLREKIMYKGFSRKFLKWFFGASLLACVWCFLQCLLDILGVSRDCTLLCQGCVSQMFGFPHPNGFAVEPQFMGNLLLAPTVVGMVLIATKTTSLWRYALTFVLMATVFLTFSRGAIYAMVVAAVFLTIYYIVRTKKWHVMVLWPVMMVAFLFTLNLQGVMAELGPTNDNYMSGAAKVLNHLSLGVADLKVEKPSDSPADGGNEAVFDGYVEESTNVRMGLTNSALKVWRKDFTTMMFGVGIGGAGEAMYAAGETGSPKEIVQNEYASLLLEIGAVGVIIVVVTMLMVLKIALKLDNAGMILTLLVAYSVTLFFFSGLPNAIHIYLMPVMLGLVKIDYKITKK